MTEMIPNYALLKSVVHLHDFLRGYFLFFVSFLVMIGCKKNMS